VPFVTGESRLVEGLYNFKEIKKNDLLGYQSKQEIIAKEDGAVLFPFYPKPMDYRKPSELCRILRRVQSGELPT